MKPITVVLRSLALAVVVLAIAGCNTERDVGKERALLKAGQQVAPDMVGWVAVPNTVPDMRQEKGASYGVLSTLNVVPETLDGWVAVNPTFFASLTGIKVDAPAAVNAQKWVLKPEGKSVPKDKNGWVAVPYSEPTIESSAHHKEREMARLAAGNIVPKEMHGWAALDRETLAKVVNEFMKTGAGARTEKSK
jgi:predicted small secreted protein